MKTFLTCCLAALLGFGLLAAGPAQAKQHLLLGSSIVGGSYYVLGGTYAKYINDTYGHVSGDKALLTLAGMIREIRRKDLISARYGGDEFLLIWLSKDGRDIP